MTEGLVVKVGGSLMDVAREIMQTLTAAEMPVLIVPGGGMFATEVRKLGIDGDAAHWMAIAAMDQYGWYLSTFGCEVTNTCALPKTGVNVLLPYQYLRTTDPLPHTWDITSDSIAAWIAGMLHCPLVLLKSVDGVVHNGEVLQKIPEGMKTDVIDPCCRPILKNHGGNGIILNGRRPDSLKSYLLGGDVFGTRLP